MGYLLGWGKVPLSQDNVPLVRGNVRLAQDNVPLAQNNVPLAQDNVPLAQDNVPLAQNNVPLAQDNVLVSVMSHTRAVRSFQMGSPELARRSELFVWVIWEYFLHNNKPLLRLMCGIQLRGDGSRC